MSKLHARLQTVLRLREHTRDERLQKLGRAISELQALDNQTTQILTEQAEVREHVKRNSDTGAVDVGLLSHCQMHLAHLERRHQEILWLRLEAQKVIDSCRQELLLADQGVKSIEKLLDKTHTEWLEEQAHQDQLALEDILATFPRGGVRS